jgi:hypothetical protein
MLDAETMSAITAERVKEFVLPNPLGTALRVALWGYAGAMQTEGADNEWTIVRPLAMDRLWFHATMQRRALIEWVRRIA